MSQTLKEFTQHHVSYDTDKNARWRRVFPTELRNRKIVTKSGYRGSILFGNRRWVETSYLQLEERWERIHRGDMLDTEWRSVYEY